jgi:hypothetical protein
MQLYWRRDPDLPPMGFDLAAAQHVLELLVVDRPPCQ